MILILPEFATFKTEKMNIPEKTVINGYTTRRVHRDKDGKLCVSITESGEVKIKLDADKSEDLSGYVKLSTKLYDGKDEYLQPIVRELVVQAVEDILTKAPSPMTIGELTHRVRVCISDRLSDAARQLTLTAESKY